MTDPEDIHTAFCSACGADYAIGADGDQVYIGCHCAFEPADEFLDELQADLPLEPEEPEPERDVGRGFQ